MSKSILEQKFKEKSIDANPEFAKQYKQKVIEQIFSELSDKRNRYIFFCPDMAAVNNLVKLVYETAFEVKSLGYEVLVLHEIDGFKCKWLLNQEEYKHLKDIKTDYIITKKSNKSKKTKSNYAFKPSDTIIIPDQFQEMVDNLLDVKILQKILLVSSYASIYHLSPGYNYSNLGINKVLFAEDKLYEDYCKIFPNSVDDFISLKKLPINKNFFGDRIDREVLPVISISNIGNIELAQQIMNTFFNLYPQLRVFSFKILDRQDMELYRENLKKSALVLLLDKVIGNSQIFLECISMGTPVGTISRDELNSNLLSNVFFGNTALEIVENLATFCSNWLSLSTAMISEGVKSIEDTSGNTYENYKLELNKVFNELQEKRIEYFAKVKQTLDSQ